MYRAGRFMAGAALVLAAAQAGAQEQVGRPMGARPVPQPPLEQPHHQRPRPQHKRVVRPGDTVKVSCTDGLHNGMESDVDCGGNCDYCELGRQCFVAADCISGRCGDGLCVERPHLSGEPVPLGYDSQLSQSDAAASTRVAGMWFFAVGYAGAFVGGLSLPGVLSELQIPVLGPWLALNNVDLPAGKVLLTIDGTLQGAGAVLLLGGFIGAGRQLVRTGPNPARVTVVPNLGPDRYGLGVFGAF